MVFSSAIFVFAFLPITVLVYYILKGKIRNYWLLAVSILFFSWSQPKYLWIIILNVIVSFLGARLIDLYKRVRKPILWITVMIELGLLFYFKYFNFTITSINQVFGSNIVVDQIILPIGISFFTFQGLSYVLDVYRETVPVQKNPMKVALYIMLFPQLIAGPIVRYKDVVAEIDDRRVTSDDLAYGAVRFIKGLAKKTIIANSMALTADTIWNMPIENNTLWIAWLGSICYTLQIYYDFSGYSDMAIGLGRMFGFHFLENFDLPYISKNITEFWRRWHISLSSWFRDYVYIPLGGNRKHVYLNLAIVFLLTGVWHGASWNFVVWGIWNGVFILLERYIKNRFLNRKCVSGSILHIYTLFLVNMGWVLFRAPSLLDAWKYIKVMFGCGYRVEPIYKLSWFLDKWTLMILVIAIFFATSCPTKINNVIKRKVNESVYLTGKYVLLLIIFAITLVRLTVSTYNPFIYFQF